MMESKTDSRMGFLMEPLKVDWKDCRLAEGWVDNLEIAEVKKMVLKRVEL